MPCCILIIIFGKAALPTRCGKYPAMHLVFTKAYVVLVVFISPFIVTLPITYHAFCSRSTCNI